MISQKDYEHYTNRFTGIRILEGVREIQRGMKQFCLDGLCCLFLLGRAIKLLFELLYESLIGIYGLLFRYFLKKNLIGKSAREALIYLAMYPKSRQ